MRRIELDRTSINRWKAAISGVRDGAGRSGGDDSFLGDYSSFDRGTGGSGSAAILTLGGNARCLEREARSPGRTRAHGMTSSSEIVVTPAMIEAGIEVYVNSGASPHLSSVDELMVREIYLSMERARRDENKTRAVS